MKFPLPCVDNAPGFVALADDFVETDGAQAKASGWRLAGTERDVEGL